MRFFSRELRKTAKIELSKRECGDAQSALKRAQKLTRTWPYQQYTYRVDLNADHMVLSCYRRQPVLSVLLAAVPLWGIALACTQLKSLSAFALAFGDGVMDLLILEVTVAVSGMAFLSLKQEWDTEELRFTRVLEQVKRMLS